MDIVEGNFGEYKGKDCVIVVDWLKIKGLHKQCSMFEGFLERFKSLETSVE